MKPHCILFSLIFILASCTVANTDVGVGTYKGGKILTSFGLDSARVEEEMRYFNCDSLFYHIMTKGYTPDVQNINVRYFVDIVEHMSYERKLKQIERFREAGQLYNCRQLHNEAEFIAIFYYPDTTEILFNKKIQMMDNLIIQMMKEKNVEFEIRCREFICNLYWGRGQYVRPFKEIPIIDKLLEQVPDVNKSGVNGASKKKFYYWFGQCYYLFRDFETAIHYYKKATVEPSELLYTPYHLYDETNLLSRIALGRYYREKNDIESSDAYFQSMLKMSDSVKRREMFDAIAYGNLGVNQQLTHNYPNAIKTMQKYLPTLVKYNHYSLATEIYISLGEAFWASGRPDEVKEKIDSAFHYISLAGDDNNLSHAFAGNMDQIAAAYLLSGKYYAFKNNIKESMSCMDSSAFYQKKNDSRYNSLVILRAKQELFQVEKGEIEQSEKLAKVKMFYAIASATLLLILLLVIYHLYQKKKKAYRVLVLRIQRWAQIISEREPLFLPYAEPIDVDHETVAKEESTTNEPGNTDIALCEKLHRLLVEEHWYRNPDITLDSTADKIGVSRNSLSQAVNRCTGKNFTTLINESRIKDAVRIMSEKNATIPTIESIAFDSGFNDRKSFYRVFKNITGLSPSEFRTNLQQK